MIGQKLMAGLSLLWPKPMSRGAELQRSHGTYSCGGDRRTMSQTSTRRTFLPANKAKPDSTVEPDRDPLPGRHSVLDRASCSWRWPLLLLLMLLAPLELDRVSARLRAPCMRTCMLSITTAGNHLLRCSALLAVPKLHGVSAAAWIR